MRQVWAYFKIQAVPIQPWKNKPRLSPPCLCSSCDVFCCFYPKKRFILVTTSQRSHKQDACLLLSINKRKFSLKFNHGAQRRISESVENCKTLGSYCSVELEFLELSFEKFHECLIFFNFLGASKALAPSLKFSRRLQ